MSDTLLILTTITRILMKLLKYDTFRSTERLIIIMCSLCVWFHQIVKVDHRQAK